MKYRGLSTAEAEALPSVEMTYLGGDREILRGDRGSVRLVLQRAKNTLAGDSALRSGGQFPGCKRV